MNELFDLPVSPSPRLAWLDRHGLTVRKLDDGKWECALDEETLAIGESEEDACDEFSLKTKLRHWSLA